MSHVFRFEKIGEDLPIMPYAVRRLLDLSGLHLSLAAWEKLPIGRRRALVEEGARPVPSGGVEDLLQGADPPATSVPKRCMENDPAKLQEVRNALGTSRPLTDAVWARLSPLARYAFLKNAAKTEKLPSIYDEVVGHGLTHLDPHGEAHMVSVEAKAVSARRAVAAAEVHLSEEVRRHIREGRVPKGDVLATARIAGIMAAKRTHELIPLCHPIAISGVEVSLSFTPLGVEVTAEVRAIDRTGVEMEALVAASTAALTIYDMVKSLDRWATVQSLRLLQKEGGRSGNVVRPLEAP